MKIIYETCWNNGEYDEELSYGDPTGDHSGQYAVTKLYCFSEYELKQLLGEEKIKELEKQI